MLEYHEKMQPHEVLIMLLGIFLAFIGERVVATRFVTFLGAVVALMGLWMFVYARRRIALVRRLRASSRRVEATVTGVFISTAVQSSYHIPKPPYGVEVKDGAGNVYQHLHLPPPVAMRFVVGRPATVYVDPQNPKRYLLEIPAA